MYLNDLLPHTSKYTSESLKKTKNKIKWRFQSGARKTSNMVELKQLYKEWDEIPPQQCERLIVCYPKCLIAVLAAKAGTSSY